LDNTGPDRPTPIFLIIRPTRAGPRSYTLVCCLREVFLSSEYSTKRNRELRDVITSRDYGKKRSRLYDLYLPALQKDLKTTFQHFLSDLESEGRKELKRLLEASTEPEDPASTREDKPPQDPRSAQRKHDYPVPGITSNNATAILGMLQAALDQERIPVPLAETGHSPLFQAYMHYVDRSLATKVEEGDGKRWLLLFASKQTWEHLGLVVGNGPSFSHERYKPSWDFTVCSQDEWESGTPLEWRNRRQDFEQTELNWSSADSIALRSTESRLSTYIRMGRWWESYKALEKLSPAFVSTGGKKEVELAREAFGRSKEGQDFLDAYKGVGCPWWPLEVVNAFGIDGSTYPVTIY